jgi:glycosyltransferase involved in cell wall biosynthesis
MTDRTMGIITFPLSVSGTTPLSHLVEIAHEISGSLYLVTGNEGYRAFMNDQRIVTVGFSHEYSEHIVKKLLQYLRLQLGMTYAVLRLKGRVQTWVFFIGGEGLPLPMAAARLTGARTAIMLAGFPTRDPAAGEKYLSRSLHLLSSITFRLADRIIVYSGSIVKERGLEEYLEKIEVAGEHFLDFSRFQNSVPVAERENIVGYIGRLNKVKGIFNFIEAIPKVLEKQSDISFLIVGDGPQRERAEELIRTLQISENVNFVGWAPHDQLPRYLNELKVLVLPSYTEGLPNVVLEAMACATPVLATPVGCVPDIVRDGETGFILPDNTPDSIANGILRAISHQELGRIAENGCELIRREYTFEHAVCRYREIIERMEGH